MNNVDYITEKAFTVDELNKALYVSGKNIPLIKESLPVLPKIEEPSPSTRWSRSPTKRPWKTQRKSVSPPRDVEYSSPLSSKSSVYQPTMKDIRPLSSKSPVFQPTVKDIIPSMSAKSPVFQPTTKDIIPSMSAKSPVFQPTVKDISQPLSSKSPVFQSTKKDYLISNKPLSSRSPSFQPQQKK
jgi:hypothetical protein